MRMREVDSRGGTALLPGRSVVFVLAMALSAVLVFLCVGTPVLAASSVWKAQKGETVIYLGGTFHLLRDGDYPLPPEFERAYRIADTLVLETPVNQLREPATQMKLLQQGVYGDGSTIGQHLSPKTYARLREYCEANGMPLQALQQMKPALLMSAVTLLELGRIGVSRQGVDQFYLTRAEKDGKGVETLETVDEQLSFLTTLADGNEDEFVAQTLEEMKTIREQFEVMVNAWRSGDADRLAGLLTAEMRTGQPQIYKRLIIDRNRNWLKIIDTYGRSQRIRFFLVGAGHLVGPDGLLEALRKRGYRVDRL